jgi:hypothetical protein
VKILRYGLIATIFGVLVICLAAVLSLPDDRGEAGGRIYIAFGFHVNTSHSFRGDTPDESGFGQDLRVLRAIVAALDAANGRGIPVMGAWDMENLFALGDTLPTHAPDILRAMQRRVAAQGDRVLPMSYSNALMGAVTPEEFEVEIGRAITNTQGTGVRDIFGAFAPIVRPQEMMSTPGSFSRYQAHGISAMALYYSAIAFDAFRAFIPPLSRQEALNPLTYENRDTGETMTIIPAYNHGDLVEMGSLRLWAADLRERQVKGEIKGDLLLFINLDADDPFWEGYSLPGWYAWLPGAGGLARLIASVSDLPYVRFTTPDRYLAGHPPGKTISFSQDTADGANTGYQSWAEKLSSHRLWTAVEEDRRRHKVVRAIYAGGNGELPDEVRAWLSAAFEQRLRLLSTTNYGIVNPFLATERAGKAEKIAAAMLDQSGKAMAAAAKAQPQAGAFPAPPAPWRVVDTLAFFGLSGSPRFLHLPVIAADAFALMNQKGEQRGLTIIGRRPDRLIALLDGELPMAEGKVFALLAGQAPAPDMAAETSTPFAAGVTELTHGLAGVVAPESFLPRIVYGGDRPETVTGTVETARMERENGLRRLLAGGKIPSPDPGGVDGSFELTLTRAEGSPCLFLQGRYHFPRTEEGDVNYGWTPALNQACDAKWQAVTPTPLSLTFLGKEAPVVVKKNYLGVESSFSLDFIRGAAPGGTAGNVNNQIAGEYVAVTTKSGGVALAADSTLLAGFAPFPLRVAALGERGWRVTVNPFAALEPSPYVQPTWGRGTGREAAWKSGVHYQSAAPSYNGASLEFALAVAPCTGGRPSERVTGDLAAFAHPPATLSEKSGIVGGLAGEVRLPVPGSVPSAGERPMPSIPTTVKAAIILDGLRHVLHTVLY